MSCSVEINSSTVLSNSLATQGLHQLLGQAAVFHPEKFVKCWMPRAAKDGSAISSGFGSFPVPWSLLLLGISSSPPPGSLCVHVLNLNV